MGCGANVYQHGVLYQLNLLGEKDQCAVETDVTSNGFFDRFFIGILADHSIYLAILSNPNAKYAGAIRFWLYHDPVFYRGDAMLLLADSPSGGFDSVLK